MSVFDETVEQRKARLRQMEKDEADARKAQLEASAALTAGVNEAYFLKQEELAKQAAETNAKNAAAQKERERTVNERNTAEAKARIEELHGRVNRPPTGFLDVYGTVEAPRTVPVVRQPEPARYSSSDPRNGMSEELIIRYGMNPDPTQPAFKK